MPSTYDALKGGKRRKSCKKGGIKINNTKKALVRHTRKVKKAYQRFVKLTNKKVGGSRQDLEKEIADKREELTKIDNDSYAFKSANYEQKQKLKQKQERLMKEIGEKEAELTTYKDTPDLEKPEPYVEVDLLKRAQQKLDDIQKEYDLKYRSANFGQRRDLDQKLKDAKQTLEDETNVVKTANAANADKEALSQQAKDEAKQYLKNAKYNPNPESSKPIIPNYTINNRKTETPRLSLTHVDSQTSDETSDPLHPSKKIFKMTIEELIEYGTALDKEISLLNKQINALAEYEGEDESVERLMKDRNYYEDKVNTVYKIIPFKR